MTAIMATASRLSRAALKCIIHVADIMAYHWNRKTKHLGNISIVGLSGLTGGNL